MPKIGTIATFYSYKGGVGRSMALANASVLLTQWGYDVLAIDFDLEAPGLENFFQSFVETEKVRQRSGVIEFLCNFLTATDSTPENEWTIDPVSIHLPRTSGKLHLWNAGVRDGDYFKNVRRLDFPEIYAKRNGGVLIEQFRNELKKRYDFILLDSRTGLTDIGGICTVQLPDMIVMLSTPTDQAFTGGLDIVERALESRQRLPFPRTVVPTIPVPSRFDVQAEFRLSQKWLDRFSRECRNVFADWLPRDAKVRNFLEMIKLPHVSFFSYGEVLPVIEYGTNDPGGLGQAYENLSALIVNKLQDVDELIESRSNYVKRARRGQEAQDVSSHPKIFISYHHSDREWLEMLRKHLMPLTKSRELLIWDDTRISTGEKWKDSILQAISSAEVAVLLVSPDYLASEFILDEELPNLLKASEERGLRIIVVMVRPCLFEETQLSRFQSANDPSRPLSVLNKSDQDAALVNVSRKIAEIAGRLF